VSELEYIVTPVPGPRSRELARRLAAVESRGVTYLGDDFPVFWERADGALVTKEELLDRVWRGIVVSEENLKVHISALRKALGSDRNLIRTEFGRGYRFIGILRSNPTGHARRGPRRAKLRVRRVLQNGRQSLQCGFNSSW